MGYLSSQQSPRLPSLGSKISKTAQPVKPILIPARWGGKCPLCECPVEVGTVMVYIPPSKSPAGLEIKGKMVHQDGECGSVYTVLVQYHATSKPLKVNGYSAIDALNTIKAKVVHTWGEIKGYEVWQGNIRLIEFQPAQPTRSQLANLRRGGL